MPRSTLSPKLQKFVRNADEGHRQGSSLYRIAKVLDIKALLIAGENDSIFSMRKRGNHPKKHTCEMQLANHVEMLFEAIARDSSDKEAEGVIIKYLEKMGLNEKEESDHEFGASDTESTDTNYKKCAVHNC
jgi:hypothetical protein